MSTILCCCCCKKEPFFFPLPQQRRSGACQAEQKTEKKAPPPQITSAAPCWSPAAGPPGPQLAAPPQPPGGSKKPLSPEPAGDRQSPFPAALRRPAPPLGGEGGKGNGTDDDVTTGCPTAGKRGKPLPASAFSQEREAGLDARGDGSPARCCCCFSPPRPGGSDHYGPPRSKPGRPQPA